MNSSPLPNRRQFLHRAGSLGLACAGFPLLSRAEDAADIPRQDAAALMTPATNRAIESGLRYLSQKQIKRGKDKGGFGSSGYSGSVGIGALGGLAFMSEGSTPDIGRFGKEVAGCAEFLCNHTQATGYIARTRNAIGNMYGHGFATLFLTQAFGMSRDKRVGEKLKAAVRLTLSAQNEQGGWRYQPSPTGADLSVTVCQIMALRAARDAGINVPDTAREKCIDYVKRSRNDDGSFRYTMRGGHSTFALTAAGLVSLFSAGIYEGEEIDKGLEYLKKRRKNVQNHYYYYGHYYAVQAMWHAGGVHWNQWYPGIRDELLKSQSKNGSWTNSSFGAEFATAMACIILQMPNDMLPIFAR